jgi:hypothetical protein
MDRSSACCWLELHNQDNTYIGNSENGDVYFKTYQPGGPYIKFTTVHIEDGDSVFPASVRLGPPRNENSYTLQ